MTIPPEEVLLPSGFPTTMVLHYGHRILRYQRTYRGRLLWGILLSLLLHVVLLAGLRRFREPPDPPTGLGYEGPTKLMNLAPVDQLVGRQQELARSRQTAGAILALELETREETKARSTHAQSPDPLSEETTPRHPRAVESRAPLRFELQENWAARPSRPDAATSRELQILTIVRPDYPPGAIRDGAEGLVTLEVRVGTAGEVLGVAILDSPHRVDLERAAVGAMYSWKFRPYLLDGRAVPFTVVVPFRFRLVD